LLAAPRLEVTLPPTFFQSMSNELRPQWSRALALTAALVVVANAFLIFPRLAKGELDLDESSTVLVASRPVAQVAVVATEFHSQPPLFYLALHVLEKWSTSERALRALPWLFMLAAGATLLFVDLRLSPLTRVVALALLLLTPYGQYIALLIRPYSLATWLSLGSFALLWQLLVAPSRWRAFGYVVVTILMVYSLAMAIWIIVAEGLAVVTALAYDAVHMGSREALIRRWLPVAALGLVTVLSLFYVVGVWRLQGAVGHPSLFSSLRDGLNPRYYVSGPRYLTQLPYGLGLIALALAAAAVAASVVGREPLVWFLMLIMALQIGLTHGFLAGRSGFGFRYLAPAFPALCILAGIGAERVAGRFRWTPSIMVASGMAVSLAAAVTFVRARGHEPIGPWRQVRADLGRMPGPKVVFFDIGWDGQRLQYEVRNDADVRVLTDARSGWATGGSHMTPDYVERMIQANARSTRMFFYQYDATWRPTIFDSAFAPAMSRLGCRRTYEREVPTYVRDVGDERKGALIVGYACHVG
jgi:hypothetical protein